MDVTPKIGKAPVTTLAQPEGSGPEEGDFLNQGQTRQAVFSDSSPRAAPSLAWSSVLHFVSPSVPGRVFALTQDPRVPSLSCCLSQLCPAQT